MARSSASGGESPTRALLAQEWFAALRRRVPAVAPPSVLLALDRNAAVTLCRVSVAGAATEGVGTRADVAIVAVSTGATEEIVRFDSRRFEVYLPPSMGPEVGPDFHLPDSGPDWPVYAIPTASPADRVLVGKLTANVYADANELLAYGTDAPDQPGRARIDRLVLGDRCGVVALGVRLQLGVLVLDPPVQTTFPPCPSGRLRSLLHAGATFSVSGRGVTVSADGRRVTLPVANGRVVPTRLRSYAGEATSSTVAVAVSVGATGLRIFSGSDGCNTVRTRIAFSTTRFVIDPARRRTARYCRTRVDTALVPFLANPTGTGAFSRRGDSITLRFLDGAVATMSVAR